ncbi:hypothetical protein HDU83_003862 [Entophlyctis luteolus]|nr:hypothetical protein HDU83_003862 [Entophlyctis luteolus]
MPVLDPASNTVIAHVPNTITEAEVESAIEVARTYKAPSAKVCMAHRQAGDNKFSLQLRADMLNRWNDRVLAHIDDLAAIATLESGKPLREARSEVLYAASFIAFFAGEAIRTNGATIPSPHLQNRTRIWTLPVPVGPCALITPWNFPLAMATRKIAPALAAGNACILKPAPETPLSALALAHLACHSENEGIAEVRRVVPTAALQVLTADRVHARDTVGRVLMRSDAVRKLSFTGSTAAGIALAQQAAGSVKRVSLELGGVAPLIVFDDADIDRAVESCMQGKFRNAGQTCIAVNRIYVQDSVHDQFVEKLVRKMEALRIGNGFDTNTTIGPLITRDAVDRVASVVRDTLASGATVVHQATVSKGVLASGGNFFPPTLLADVPDQSALFANEVFGPVAGVARFSDEDEVIKRANATSAGLAGYVFTRDVGRVHRVSEAINVGMVGVNECAISNEVAPFGGVKHSGIGREGSVHGIDEYLDTKYVCLGL